MTTDVHKDKHTLSKETRAANSGENFEIFITSPCGGLWAEDPAGPDRRTALSLLHTE